MAIFHHPPGGLPRENPSDPLFQRDANKYKSMASVRFLGAYSNDWLVPDSHRFPFWRLARLPRRLSNLFHLGAAMKKL